MPLPGWSYEYRHSSWIGCLTTETPMASLHGNFDAAFSSKDGVNQRLVIQAILSPKGPLEKR